MFYLLLHGQMQFLNNPNGVARGGLHARAASPLYRRFPEFIVQAVVLQAARFGLRLCEDCVAKVLVGVEQLSLFLVAAERMHPKVELQRTFWHPDTDTSDA